MEKFLSTPITVEIVLYYFLGYAILMFCKGILKGIKNKK
jgi:hypothetical protein